MGQWSPDYSGCQSRYAVDTAECLCARHHVCLARAHPSPEHQGVVVLGYLAGISRRAPLGIAVLILPYRQPLVTAKVELVWLRRRLDAANHGVDVVMERPIGSQHLGWPRIRRV